MNGMKDFFMYGGITKAVIANRKANSSLRPPSGESGPCAHCAGCSGGNYCAARVMSGAARPAAAAAPHCALEMTVETQTWFPRSFYGFCPRLRARRPPYACDMR
ncbi:hypothetical protein JYU34_002545 [Plutella xylostella]|uniref:Uncharacterized protein n=1 Tax=Plutella xylostella TaxID=51655 RepID=A0ABQ7R2G9_PLUXY|nr:hypothetical protein JYU34_002545 [Plutella xylostella]